MNTLEKLKAIMERLKAPEGASKSDIGPQNLSFMLIMQYMDALSKLGLVDGTHGITQHGKDFISVCEEFDWKPTDEELLSFVEEMIPPQDRPAIFYFLTQQRDNPEGLKKKIQESKDSEG